MKRKTADFFDELEFTDGFFAELDEMIRQDALALARLERYWAKRAANLPKAQRLHKRMCLVRDFDIWEATKHIVPDFFDNCDERYEAVKALHTKRERILWVLTVMYNYWGHDHVLPGANPRKGMKYSKQRKLYLGLLDKLAEKVKQDNWDRKRARVRERRLSKEVKAEKKDKRAQAIATLMRLGKKKTQDGTFEWDI